MDMESWPTHGIANVPMGHRPRAPDPGIVPDSVSLHSSQKLAFEEVLHNEFERVKLSILSEFKFSLEMDRKRTERYMPEGQAEQNAEGAERLGPQGFQAVDEVEKVKDCDPASAEGLDQKDARAQSLKDKLGRQPTDIEWDKLASGFSEKTLLASMLSTDYEGGNLTASFRSLPAFAESPVFDMAVALIVLVNIFVLCAETQMDGVDIGNRLFAYSTTEYSNTWKMVFNVLDWMFLAIYVVEMAFKLIVLRCQYFKSGWNLIDGLAVVLSIACRVLEVDSRVNPKLVRLARFGKLFRLTHIFRSMVIFDSFRLLVKSLKSSGGALFWSFLFLFVIISSCAFILNQFVIGYLKFHSNKAGEKELEVFNRFGTLGRAEVTMFEMTLGNWGPPTWLLVDHVNEAWAFFMVAYKIMVGFACVNVINAVFLRLTMKAADKLDGHAVATAKKEAQKYKEKINELFDTLDIDGSGFVSYDEFYLVCKSTELRIWMKLMNVSARDIDELWHAMDNGDGEIDRNEFMDGFTKLGGFATAVDAIALKSMIRELSEKTGYPIVKHKNVDNVALSG